MRKAGNLTTTAIAAALFATGVAAQEQGGTLTVPIITATFVEDFNPFSNAQEDLVRGTMFEPLWAHNVMQGEIEYRLAESFEYGDDLMSMEFRYRDIEKGKRLEQNIVLHGCQERRRKFLGYGWWKG